MEQDFEVNLFHSVEISNIVFKILPERNWKGIKAAMPLEIRNYIEQQLPMNLDILKTLEAWIIKTKKEDRRFSKLVGLFKDYPIVQESLCAYDWGQICPTRGKAMGMTRVGASNVCTTIARGEPEIELNGMTRPTTQLTQSIDHEDTFNSNSNDDNDEEEDTGLTAGSKRNNEYPKTLANKKIYRWRILAVAFLVAIITTIVIGAIVAVASKGNEPEVPGNDYSNDSSMYLSTAHNKSTINNQNEDKFELEYPLSVTTAVNARDTDISENNRSVSNVDLLGRLDQTVSSETSLMILELDSIETLPREPNCYFQFKIHLLMKSRETFQYRNVSITCPHLYERVTFVGLYDPSVFLNLIQQFSGAKVLQLKEIEFPSAEKSNMEFINDGVSLRRVVLVKIDHVFSVKVCLDVLAQLNLPSLKKINISRSLIETDFEIHLDKYLQAFNTTTALMLYNIHFCSDCHSFFKIKSLGILEDLSLIVKSPNDSQALIFFDYLVRSSDNNLRTFQSNVYLSPKNIGLFANSKFHNLKHLNIYLKVGSCQSYLSLNFTNEFKIKEWVIHVVTCDSYKIVNLTDYSLKLQELNFVSVNVTVFSDHKLSFNKSCGGDVNLSNDPPYFLKCTFKE